MEDRKIVELYHTRDESAIAETNRKYGRYCHAIAYRILQNDRDSEECVSDTWMRAWDSMPPNKPDILSVFLGKIIVTVTTQDESELNKLRAIDPDGRVLIIEYDPDGGAALE